MPILDYDSGTGLFDKLGKIFHSQQKVVDHVTNLRTRRDLIVAEYTAAQYPWIDNTINQINLWIADCVTQLQGYQADATTTLIEYIHSLIPLPEKTVVQALTTLRAQMIADAETIKACTHNLTNDNDGLVMTAAGTNIGNGKAVLFGLINASANARIGSSWPAETVTAKCIAASGDADNPRLEMWQVYGANARDGMDPDWPGGSGINITLPAISPYFDNQIGVGRNVLRNGAFDSGAGNVPDGWQLAGGATAGSDVSMPGIGSAYVGANALRLLDAAVAGEGIKQRLGHSSGSQGDIQKDTQYIAAVAAKRSTVGSSTAFFFRLADAGGTTIWGSLYYPTAVTNAWQILHQRFRANATVPSERWAEITTDGIGAFDVDIDNAIIAPMHPLLSLAGPLIAILPGSTPAVAGDIFTAGVTNTQDGLFAKWFQRNWNILHLGIPLPESGAPTIADALVA